MDDALAKSYDHCRSAAKQSGSNFYLSFLLLPPEKRSALCAVYAFMRHCDDLSDSAENAASAKARLKELRSTLEEMLSGHSPDAPRSALHAEYWPALADVVRRYGIPTKHFHEVIDGVEMDLSVTRYATLEELYRYCYFVASAVGLICVCIFGYKDDSALKAAEHMGVAFQLTNILRDVKEDAARGRIYLPTEDLAQFGVTEQEVLEGRWSERFAQLVQFEAGRAESYYTRASALFSLVKTESRPTLVAMERVYHGILRKIQRPGFNVMRRQARLSAPRKLGILVWARVARKG